MATLHPRLNDHGQKVVIQKPGIATPLSAWSNPAEVATVLPDGPMPAGLGGVPFAPLANLPGDAAGWERLAAAGPAFDEPVLVVPAGLKPAAGVVVREADGRIWLVSPTNAFGGYVNTFPKGKQEGGLSLRATAVKEALEESGLLVELTGFLLDALRSTSVTRYYAARRIGGTPAAAGWETQAVHLVPRAALGAFLTAAADAPLLALSAAA